MELVTMPQLGETVTEGTITRWYKSVGEPVAADEDLFEVSTDKIDTDVPSAHAGFLRAIHVGEGETVPIGTPLAVITATADEPFEPDDGGPRVAAAEASSARDDGGPATAPSPASPADDGAPSDRRPSDGAPGARAPSARAPSVRTGVRAPRPSATRATPRSPAPVGTNGDGFLSPVVRQLLAEHGLQPGDVQGSGRDGRITRNDVLAAAANPPRATSTATAPSPVAGPTGAGLGVALASVPQPGPDDDVVEFSKARRATAQHMVRSLATSAHTLVVTEVDYFRLDPVRRRAGLSFLPFVARAAIDTLRAFPHLNSSVGDDQLIVHRSVHLGVAVDVGFEALVVPIVRNTADLHLVALSSAIAAQAERARSKQLTADDLTGGTFTITNVGSYGTVVTGPVINQPQVAILSSDGIRMRPTAVRDGAGEWLVAVHPLGNLSLSFDHRAVDGAYAAAFLARVREVLEERDWTEEL